MNAAPPVDIEIGSGQPVHATAIIAGELGLLFTGPSGAGKTLTALNCLVQARLDGQFAALIADDRVMLSSSGGKLVARCPAAIAGKAEIRGSGIFTFDSRSAARIDCLIAPGALTGGDRIPDPDEVFRWNGGEIPVLRLAYGSGMPFHDIISRAVRMNGHRR